MTIKYVNCSAPVEDGYYLVREDDDLLIAEWNEGEWQLTGIDYPVWESSRRVIPIEVICKFDLEAIAAGAAKQV